MPLGAVAVIETQSWMTLIEYELTQGSKAGESVPAEVSRAVRRLSTTRTGFENAEVEPIALVFLIS